MRMENFHNNAPEALVIFPLAVYVAYPSLNRKIRQYASTHQEHIRRFRKPRHLRKQGSI